MSCEPEKRRKWAPVHEHPLTTRVGSIALPLAQSFAESSPESSEMLPLSVTDAAGKDSPYQFVADSDPFITQKGRKHRITTVIASGLFVELLGDNPHPVAGALTYEFPSDQTQTPERIAATVLLQPNDAPAH